MSKRSIVLITGFLMAGCYNTKGIVSGGLVCGTNRSCPDGFYCDTTIDLRGLCYKNGEGPSSTTDPGSTGCSSGTLPYGPFSGCQTKTPANSTCDPVCQSGCPCNHRCITNAKASSYFCETTVQSETFAKHMDRCNLKNGNSNCTPGAICLEDSLCNNLCYRTCRQDADCPTSTRCTKAAIISPETTAGSTVTPVVNICSPLIETCNPIGNTPSCSGSRNAGITCVLLAKLTGTAGDNETVCDCKSTHDKPIGTTCSTEPDDCVPGAVCVAGTCRQLCVLGAGASCTNKQCVSPVYGSKRYGWCL
jgi:hypothetical protein